MLHECASVPVDLIFISNCDKSVNKERGTGTGNEEPERGTRNGRGTRNRNGERGTGTGNEALERGTRKPMTLSK